MTSKRFGSYPTGSSGRAGGSADTSTLPLRAPPRARPPIVALGTLVRRDERRVAEAPDAALDACCGGAGSGSGAMAASACAAAALCCLARAASWRDDAPPGALGRGAMVGRFSIATARVWAGGADDHASVRADCGGCTSDGCDARGGASTGCIPSSTCNPAAAADTVVGGKAASCGCTCGSNVDAAGACGGA